MGSVQKTLIGLASALRRDFVCMELNANFQPAERAKALKRFPSSEFKRVAAVVMGEPTKAYKERIHKMMLDEKIANAERNGESSAKKRKTDHEEEETKEADA